MKESFSPGEICPRSGQYKNKETGTEITIVRGEAFPPTSKPGEEYELVYFQHSNEDESKRIAFVIMPFDREFNGIFKDLVAPSFEDEGFTVHRADSVLDQQNIMKEIVQGIHRADLIVAELTSLNPNVMYELGIAHGLRKPTVVLTQSVENLPFDLRSYRVVHYSTSYDKVVELKDRLREIAEKLKEKSITFGNPVSDFVQIASQTVARGDVGQEVKPSVTPEEAKLVEPAKQEEGELLDFMVEVESSAKEITELMVKTNEANRELVQRMEARTAEVESVKGQGTPGSSLKVHRIAMATASDMIQYAQIVEDMLPEFNSSWERFVDNTTDLWSRIRIETDEDYEGAKAFITQMEDLQKTISGFLVAIQSARQGIVQMKGISRDLNRAVQRTERTLDGILEEHITAQSYIARILNLIHGRFEDSGK